MASALLDDQGAGEVMLSARRFMVMRILQDDTIVACETHHRPAVFLIMYPTSRASPRCPIIRLVADAVTVVVHDD